MTRHEQAPQDTPRLILERIIHDPRPLSPVVLADYNWRYTWFQPDATIHPLVWVNTHIQQGADVNLPRIIALLGASASGKDTILSKLKEKLTIIQIQTTTTRSPRRGQDEFERTYNFVSEQQFNSMAELGQFIETVRLGNNYSGTRGAIVEALSKTGLIVWRGEENGLRQLWSNLDRKIPRAVVFIMPNMPMESLRKRIIDTRGKKDSEWRITQALREVYYEGYKADYIVLNPPQRNGPIDATEAMYKLFTYLGATPK